MTSQLSDPAMREQLEALAITLRTLENENRDAFKWGEGAYYDGKADAYRTAAYHIENILNGGDSERPN